MERAGVAVIAFIAVLLELDWCSRIDNFADSWVVGVAHEMTRLAQRGLPVLLPTQATPPPRKDAPPAPFSWLCRAFQKASAAGCKAKHWGEAHGSVARCQLVQGRSTPRHMFFLPPQGRGRARFLIGARLLRAIMDISAHAI